MPNPEAPSDFEKSLKNVQTYPFVHKYLPFERYLIRPPAFLVVKAFAGTRVTPNQLTLISSVIGLAAGAAYLGATRGWFIAAGFLVMLSSVFDCADGQLARLKGLGSRYGAYLDLFFDRITDFAAIAGVAVGWARYSQKPFYLAFGLVTCALYFLEVNLYYILNQYTQAAKTGESAEGRGVAITLFFVTSLAARLDALIFGLFVYSTVNIVIKVIRFLRLGRVRPEAPLPGKPAS